MIVDNPDAVFAKAIAAGATSVWPVGNQHGWRLGRVVDPFVTSLGDRQADVLIDTPINLFEVCSVSLT
jgi:hypothetical protein